MKKKNFNLNRLESVIEKDRTCKCDAFSNLFYVDLNKLLGEYFEYSDKPLVNIIKNNGEVVLEIKLVARRLLYFGEIPKD